MKNQLQNKLDNLAGIWLTDLNLKPKDINQLKLLLSVRQGLEGLSEREFDDYRAFIWDETLRCFEKHGHSELRNIEITLDSRLSDLQDHVDKVKREVADLKAAITYKQVHPDPENLHQQSIDHATGDLQEKEMLYRKLVNALALVIIRLELTRTQSFRILTYNDLRPWKEINEDEKARFLSKYKDDKFCRRVSTVIKVLLIDKKSFKNPEEFYSELEEYDEDWVEGSPGNSARKYWAGKLSQLGQDKPTSMEEWVSLAQEWENILP